LRRTWTVVREEEGKRGEGRAEGRRKGRGEKEGRKRTKGGRKEEEKDEGEGNKRRMTNPIRSLVPRAKTTAIVRKAERRKKGEEGEEGRRKEEDSKP
jgi:hypothetical protein